MTSSNPAAELVLLVTGYRVSQAIHVAATLGIADLIKDGASSASDLAVATNSHAGALYRVLRALAAAGVFHGVIMQLIYAAKKPNLFNSLILLRNS